MICQKKNCTNEIPPRRKKFCSDRCCSLGAGEGWKSRNREKFLAAGKRRRRRPEVKASCKKYREQPHRRKIDCEITKKLQAARRAFVARLKSAPCVDCGQVFHWCCMDFDHVRGEKIACIKECVSSRSLDVLVKELEKCDLVCANCHRMRTFSRSHNGVTSCQ